MMLDNSTYNKIKTLNHLSKLCWFIDKHALKDAELAGDQECVVALMALQKDLEKHIEKLQKSVCIISQ